MVVGKLRTVSDKRAVLSSVSDKFEPASIWVGLHPQDQLIPDPEWHQLTFTERRRAVESGNRCWNNVI